MKQIQELEEKINELRNSNQQKWKKKISFFKICDVM